MNEKPKKLNLLSSFSLPASPHPPHQRRSSRPSSPSSTTRATSHLPRGPAGASRRPRRRRPCAWGCRRRDGGEQQRRRPEAPPLPLPSLPLPFPSRPASARWGSAGQGPPPSLWVRARPLLTTPPSPWLSGDGGEARREGEKAAEGARRAHGRQ